MSVVESGVDNCRGEALREFAVVKKEGNEFLGFLRIVALKVGKRIRLFVARSVGGGSSDRFTKGLDKFKNKRLIRETNAKSVVFGFKCGNNFAFRLRDNGNRAREKVLIDVFGCLVEIDIVFGHGLISDSNRNSFALTVTFEVKKFLNSLGIGSVGTDAITSFGGVDDEVALVEFFDGGLNGLLWVSGGEINDVHRDYYTVIDDL